ncbi:hypothetical protein ID858_11670 [Xenorhabdus sp. DI]|uniref:hypothetical protein n=1 Tax=Xenorhabdus doucetiae TaxID=351671 RepID=UPI00199118D0|nr:MULTISPECIES: hypothetical protein [unclassified Xenorhabdus]MBD2785777.1 hypothetical protein [Xenorhabdus sp. 3]MBD2789166.1 hypothetical protein [Xenorhabdus sp. DI]
MKLSYKDYINTYLSATKNQIAFDDCHRNIQKKWLPYIPRISKWLKFWLISPFFINALFFIIFLLFSLGGFIFYSLLCFFNFVYIYATHIIKEKNNLNLKKKKNKELYYIALSSLGYESLEHAFLNNHQITIITVPWVKINKKEKYSYLSILSLINIFDIIKVFFNSLVAGFFFLLSSNERKWFLQFYTAPKWFLVAAAIDKINGDIITSEHFDRWAVLLDTISLYKNINLILIQHGSLKAFHTSEYSNLEIPYKLRNISCIHVYDEEELNIFKNKIIKNELSGRLEVNFIRLKINLTNIDNVKFKILYIGHPLCENFQMHLYNELCRKIPETLFFYKEHPQARASNKARYAGWEFIEKKDRFPNVNIVISYPSTLAFQYQEEGVDVVTHDLTVEKITNIECNIICELIYEKWKSYEEKKL